MKILMGHDRYRNRGGEDEVYDAETSLLESHGHTVIRHIVHNDRIDLMGRVRLGATTIWSRSSRRDIRDLVRRERPDVAHFYNTFPLLSPSVYGACKKEGVPVVQSIHNYRLMCANGTFFRAGQPCEDCLGKFLPLNAIYHKCYRDQRAASAAVVAMLVAHRTLGTWSSQVDLYLAGVTEFARAKFIAGGLPAEKILLKPNFVPDPGTGTGAGGYALFVGRLTREKGVATLIEAWKRVGSRMPLRVVGDGAMSIAVADAAGSNASITWLGRRPLPEVHALLKEASFLVFPSTWYEALPRIIVDSFAVGTPVLASNLGAMGDLIVDGTNGRHFRAGDAGDLAEKALGLASDPALLARLRVGARADFEKQYTADRNYEMIMDAYRRVLPGKPS